MSAGLEVISPGLMTSVQDRGRFGYQALGISVSGALDTDSFDIANALVGNTVSYTHLTLPTTTIV